MADAMRQLKFFLILILVAAPCYAKTITVDDDGPADFQGIQDAIYASWHGDTIFVAPGIYNENVSFAGRAITVVSQNPDDPTIVQSTVISVTSGYSVSFDFSETSDSVLMGFTITGRGVYCYSTSPTVMKNVIRDCASDGIYGRNNATPNIVDNLISYNDLCGIYNCDGPISGNTISQNNGGIAYCDGTIVGNLISNNSNLNPGSGGGLCYCQGSIVDNVIADNYASSKGGAAFGCNGSLINNIIAGNKSRLAGGGLYACCEFVTNNTIVGNWAGTYGGGFSDCPGAVVMNNIIVLNRAEIGAGIFGVCDNAYNNFWMNQNDNFAGGASAGQGDFVVDPLFAIDGYWDDNGTEDQSDDLWVDGDYHLKSERGRWDPVSKTWILDSETSRCIDAGDPGSDWTEEFWPHGKRINLGVYGGTVQASMSLSDLGNIADVDKDDWVDYSDLALFVEKWTFNETLLVADLNRDAIVNFEDFAILAKNWKVQPPPSIPPSPDPMTWAKDPYPTSAYSIVMVATTAISTDGSGVEYYFVDWYHQDYNSGWISFAPGQEPKWEDTGLLPNTVYSYRVKARNKANRLETDWSGLRGTSTLAEDSEAPTPNPSTWEVEPYASSATSIGMEAATAVDESGVEYQFECTSHPAYSSDWQDSPIYEVGSLPKANYTFVVRARDKSPNQNTTVQSASVTVDLKPPTPDPMRWEVQPYKYKGGPGSFDWYATMTAVEAEDESGGVEYKFKCTTESGFSSGWQSSRTWTVQIGGGHVVAKFCVKARDISSSQNETGWSSEVPAN
jgi:hypothetical protein